MRGLGGGGQFIKEPVSVSRTSVAMLLLVTLLTAVCSAHSYLYQTKYTQVKVDHFNFRNNDTFNLRYLVNDTWWWPQKGGPIFFYTGNEGDVTMFADNTGLMWELAPQFHALVIFAEHRYYGESMPYGNKSLDNKEYFGYLSSSQALADFVDVLHDIRSKYGLMKTSNPVISFGGSYGGMLSAWFRMKYPAETIGALASSAPIWQFQDLTPCEAFNNVVSSVYKQQGTGACFDGIKQSWDAIDKLVQTESGRLELSKQFLLCNALNKTEDGQELKNWLADIWVNLVMLNYPYETNFLIPLPANPVKTACYQFSQGEKGLLGGVFAAASVFFNTSGEAKCLDFSNANGKLGNGWDLQACTEMVMPMCSVTSSMFQPSAWDLKTYSAECYKKFGVLPEQYLVEKLYGGREISSASNIIFSNGLLDPWSSGGVVQSISHNVVAVVMPDSAHHLDLRAANPRDPTSVRRARSYYVHVFKSWIKNHTLKNTRSTT